LLLPVALWIGLFLRGTYSVREHTGALLAFIWQLQSGLIVALLLQGDAQISLILGQAVMLGAIMTLLTTVQPLPIGVAACAALLFFYAPASPMFWQWYVSNLLCVCLPSLLLGRWTAQATHIYLRAILQTICWACLLLWLFPFTVFHQLKSGWEPLLNRSALNNMLFLAPMIVPGLLLLSASYQFSVEGNGTGFPYDPPEKLVTKGIYAYISNPMQLGICVLMLCWGFALMSIWICASAFVALFLFIVFKDICNGSCAIGKSDQNWQAYQREVPKWIPRLTPWTS
jgi:protein-S-isoprenylcysteine O-methyltransferase Ste14